MWGGGAPKGRTAPAQPPGHWTAVPSRPFPVRCLTSQLGPRHIFLGLQPGGESCQQRAPEGQGRRGRSSPILDCSFPLLSEALVCSSYASLSPRGSLPARRPGTALQHIP